MLKKLFLVFLLSFLCSLVHAVDVDPPALMACQKTCSAYLDRMASDLHDVFLEEGIIGAIDICAERVNNTAAEYSQKPGLRLERLTLLTLKDQKRFDSFEAITLLAMHDSVAAGGEIPPEAYKWTGKDIHNGTLVYVKPIIVEPLCLTCHGPAEMVQPDVRAIMLDKYHALPSGNKIGEIKGAIVVTLELPAGKELVAECEEHELKE